MKKKTPKKLKPRFKEGEIVWNPHIGKKEKYKHSRDVLRFYLVRYNNQDK